LGSCWVSRYDRYSTLPFASGRVAHRRNSELLLLIAPCQPQNSTHSTGRSTADFKLNLVADVRSKFNSLISIKCDTLLAITHALSAKTNVPMIVLFTDFGSDDPYVGQMKAVLVQQAPEIPVIDLLHNAPRFNMRASAHLLAAYSAAFPADSILLGVVDPGVGDVRRKAIAINIGRRWCVGPENGLFDVLAARAMLAQADVVYWEITWRPENLSNSFHGRDLFAPVAACLARDEMPQGVQVDRSPPVAVANDLPEVIYIDHYGNAITGVRANQIASTDSLKVGEHIVVRANTFCDVAVGQAFCYENANGLMEIAINQGSAAHSLGLSIGSRVSITLN